MSKSPVASRSQQQILVAKIVECDPSNINNNGHANARMVVTLPSLPANDIGSPVDATNLTQRTTDEAARKSALY
eukprot:1819980-Pleurochrysis_carterae.AAC.1